MRFHTQEYRHDPKNGEYGDCQRAVIASLLDLELSEVPNFNEGGPDSFDFFERLDSFLASKGLGRLSVAFNGDSIVHATRHMAAHYSENQPYMLSGKSPRGANHVVIFKGIELLWDTHPDGGGLIGPCTDGYYWVEVLTPLLQVPAPDQQKGSE